MNKLLYRRIGRIKDLMRVNNNENLLILPRTVVHGTVTRRSRFKGYFISNFFSEKNAKFYIFYKVIKSDSFFVVAKQEGDVVGRV